MLIMKQLLFFAYFQVSNVHFRTHVKWDMGSHILKWDVGKIEEKKWDVGIHDQKKWDVGY